MRSVPAALLLMIVAAAPVSAGQSDGVVDLWRAPNALPSADSGKPAIPTPSPAIRPTPGNDCLAAMPCGMRLLGTVQRNGAVELQVPALRW